jgi:hypothetical protein
LIYVNATRLFRPQIDFSPSVRIRLMLTPTIPARSMAKVSGLKIGLSILVVALLGVSAMQASFAKSSEHSRGSRENAGSKSEGHAGTKEGRRANDKQDLKAGLAGDRKGRGVGSGRRGVAKGVNSFDARGGDANAIDTRITVQPRRPGGTPGKVPDAKSRLKIGTPSNFHARRLPAPGAPDLNARNAIGQPVTQRQSIRGRNGEGHGFQIDGGINRSTIVRPSASPMVGASVVRRGAITGTGVIRPGFNSSGVGGRGKVATGINGTNIRPKHP